MCQDLHLGPKYHSLLKGAALGEMLESGAGGQGSVVMTWNMFCARVTDSTQRIMKICLKKTIRLQVPSLPKMDIFELQNECQNRFITLLNKRGIYEFIIIQIN